VRLLDGDDDDDDDIDIMMSPTRDFLPAWIEPNERSSTARRLRVGLGGGDGGRMIECDDEDFLPR